MARQWRIEYSGAMYHIMSRGNEGRAIFFDDSDRFLFTNVLEDMICRFRIEVHAWVLMPNHYHLLIKTMEPNLSRCMQWFGAVFTRRYNVKHNRKGHLFQGRYRSLLVEDNDYLLRLSCYIHRNPLRAKLVKRLIEYQWSSYGAYAYGKTGDDWLSTRLILSQMNSRNNHETYRKLVQSYSEEEKSVMEDIRSGFIFGSERFSSKIMEKFMPDSPHVEIPQQKWLREEESNLQETIKEVCLKLGYNLRRMKEMTRVRGDVALKRDLLVLYLWSSGRFSNNEIGNCFGITYSTVSRRVGIAKMLVDSEEKYYQEYSRIKSLIKM